MVEDLEQLVALLPPHHYLYNRIHTLLPLVRLLQEETSSVTLLKAVLGSGILPNKALIYDVELMLEDPVQADIPESAFITAVGLLLASYLTDFWPNTILVPPQDTINFKHGTRTLIIDGEMELALFDCKQAPHYVTFKLPDLAASLGSLVQQQATELQDLLTNEPTCVAPHAAEAAPSEEEKAPWEGLYDTFMPLLISMTFNSPLQFWELNYMQQQSQFDAAAEEQDKVSSLAVWFGYEPILVALHEIKQVTPNADAAILDLGCGNGHVCELLLALGFTNVHGLDYSDAAIRLARSVRRMYREQRENQRRQGGGVGDDSTGETETGVIQTGGIEYVVGDALATGIEGSFFDVIYDKGTFDSIACVSKKFVKSRPSLMPPHEQEEDDEAKSDQTRKTTTEDTENAGGSGNEEQEEKANDDNDEADDEDDRVKYCREVHRLLKPGGYFVITSQCHDEDELLRFFTREPEGEATGCELELVKNLTDSFADLRLMIFRKPALELDQD